jgi:hypothetical protein
MLATAMKMPVRVKIASLDQVDVVGLGMVGEASAGATWMAVPCVKQATRNTDGRVCIACDRMGSKS